MYVFSSYSFPKEFIFSTPKIADKKWRNWTFWSISATINSFRLSTLGTRYVVICIIFCRARRNSHRGKNIENLLRTRNRQNKTTENSAKSIFWKKRFCGRSHVSIVNKMTIKYFFVYIPWSLWTIFPLFFVNFRYDFLILKNKLFWNSKIQC